MRWSEGAETVVGRRRFRFRSARLRPARGMRRAARYQCRNDNGVISSFSRNVRGSDWTSRQKSKSSQRIISQGRGGGRALSKYSS